MGNRGNFGSATLLAIPRGTSSWHLTSELLTSELVRRAIGFAGATARMGVATSGAHWGQAPEIYTDHASLEGRPDGGDSPGE
jgi:hypothetical protein